LKEDNPIAKFSRVLNDAVIASGRVPASEGLLRERLEKAGFVDVQSFTLRMIIGPWAKDKYVPSAAVHLSIVKAPHSHRDMYIGLSKN
jgi:hypothetical protein